MKQLRDMAEYDTIIIGSGAGGLAAAICLARAGQHVLVLEQHYVPGGWCHSFYLDGHRFSPGVHYLGLLGPGQGTRQLYEGLGIANNLTFFRMNPAAYEHCWIGNERVDLPADFEELYEQLAARFPHEREGLRKYLTVVRQVNEQLHLIPKMSGFWDNITIPFRTAQLGKYGLFSLKRVMDWHIKDRLLQGILNVQCGDHGLPPALASFPLHCAVMGHYQAGGFYPSGGGAALVKAMTSTLKRHGGEVRTSAAVRRILTEPAGPKKTRAVGVELASGEIIRAKRIISNADPAKTYGMVGHEHLSPKLLAKLAKTSYSVTSLMLFLVVDMDVRAAGLDSGNIWMLRHPDLDKLFSEMKAADILAEDEFPALFISCTTIKDPASFDGRHHCLEVVTFLDFKAFETFDKGGDYHTSAYAQFKERIIEKLLNSVEKAVPGIRAHIVTQELGTPLTNEFYVQSTRGNVYGTEKNFRQTGPFAFGNKSEIEGLYLCGASILSHGVAGATYSGVQTAARILNSSMDAQLVPEPGQAVRVYEAEDPATWPEWVHQKRRDRARRLHSQPQP
ncbi:NAD(P)/FAD-dependent oxidoreductase [Hymenobacter sp. DH14]|uniref:NAD(P)/FAD-dependent oxidoreductase n=1 Tax=Hymenobacter cyanobacteriorum TaxID=2926463 RepID=A0A9X2AE43_9BACT|nr:NAD(P)/FAD-dependent oxidoreductase [Hymenobacter cyanobacteriorum]MCI1186397.1 NAD(P)/FAD-dependent oxidoreductase [Hymenobacter cyanobacteriorum]